MHPDPTVRCEECGSQQSVDWSDFDAMCDKCGADLAESGTEQDDDDE